MGKTKNKEPQIHKTTAQLEAEAKRVAEIARKRAVIVDKFYPALVKATVSVDEAKALTGAMVSMLMSSVMKTMRERQFAEILQEVASGLCPDEADARMPDIRALLGTLENENLFVARELMEGMTQAIAAMINKDMQGRTLESMTPDWDKFLK